MSTLKYSPKFRALRTVKSIVVPNKKKGMSPKNFSYLNHITRKKSNSILFPSYPASGWNWTSDILNYALGKHVLGQYSIQYDQNANTLKSAEIKPFRLINAADARASNAPLISEFLPTINMDYCYHTHGYWGESPLWGLDKAKTVLVIRDFPTSLFSQYSKRREKYATFEDFLDSENGLNKLIHFYNSWGDFIFKNKMNQIYIVKYEDMRENTLPTFKKLISFCFNINISEEILTEALDYYSFEKQKERELEFNSNEKRHFHYKGKKNYKEEINAETYNKIRSELTIHLKHKFGYNY